MRPLSDGGVKKDSPFKQHKNWIFNIADFQINSKTIVNNTELYKSC